MFPDDFLWGASTAGHQVDCGSYDQWTAWELKHAKGLAKTAHSRMGWMPDWQKFKGPATTPENYLSGKGVDHFHRYKEDFDIVQKLGLNAFRFSIEWSRLEPQEGVWDRQAIDHYHNYIAELKKRGIEPILSIWHWTQPLWFEEQGGFTKSGNVGHFLRFVQKITDEYGSDVRYIITLNEPNMYVFFSYFSKRWPPMAKNPLSGLRVGWNLLQAHKYAYTLIKHTAPHMQVGVAYNVSNNQPKDHSRLLDKMAAWVANYTANWWFLNRIKRYQDFVGLNYYYTNYFNGTKMDNPKDPHNDLGWYMEPSGLSECLTQAWIRYHKPIIVTENGVADADDQYRQWWLKETMLAMLAARKAGAQIHGYLHWSLLDNFEWDSGWWPKFGLVSVDRENGMRRQIRPSALWWARQIAQFRDADKHR